MGLDSTLRRGAVSAAVAALLAAGPTMAFADQTTPTVTPTPQSISFGTDSINLSNGVNLVSDGGDSDAVAALRTMLNAHKVTVNTTTDASDPTVYVGETDDAAQTKAAAGLGLDASKLDDEGYVLGSNAQSDVIVLQGHDGDGTFYAVQTFAQLIQDASILDVKVTDEPEMAHRGVIEGFYAGSGANWSWQDRQNQIKYYGSTKLNTYIYAPKDDPYHREKWREPYPEDQLQQMKQLVDLAAANKVDFVFAISPGQTIDLTSEDDFDALVSKCQTMYDMGVRHFAIFFDDITLNVEDPGTKQAELLNRFQKEFLDARGDCGPLITVPTKYDSLAMIGDAQENGFNEYTNHFSQTLDKRIQVLYTGGAVVPEGISTDNLELVKRAYGDRMGIWWNYNCNDYLLNKLALGPIYGLDNGLGNLTDYLVVNPMGWADMNKITEASAADYGWNTAAYNQQRSFSDAIHFAYGNGELAQAMSVFANHSTRMSGGSNSSGRDDAPEVRALMDRVLKKAARVDDLASDADVAALRKEFASMQQASTYLQQHAAEVDATNASDVAKNFAKLGVVGQADDKALDLLIAKVSQDQDQVAQLTSELQNEQASLSSGKLVSEGCGVKFVSDVLGYEITPTAAFSVSQTLVRPGQAITLSNESSLSAAEYSWSFPGATVATSADEAPSISYEHEGRYTITLTVKNRFGQDVATKKQIITVSKNAPQSVQNLALNKTATANSSTGSSEAPSMAVDGVTTTKWCSTVSGSWLMIDLGSEQTITGYSLSNAAVGGEGSALNTNAWHIEVSSDAQSRDGGTWTEVSRVTGNTQDKVDVSIPVTKARYVRLSIDKPTSNSDSATRIFEFEVLGAPEDIELPAEYVEPDWSKLDQALTASEGLTNTGYTEQSWNAFVSARTAAQSLRASNYATQEQVDAAVEALSTAQKGLEPQVLYTVIFDDGLSGTQNAQVQVAKGQKVTRPQDPTRAGYTFAGWFIDAAGTTAWNFDQPVSANMTLYAKWNPVAEQTPQQNPSKQQPTNKDPQGLPQTGDVAGITGILAAVSSACAGLGFGLRRRLRK